MLFGARIEDCGDTEFAIVSAETEVDAVDYLKGQFPDAIIEIEDAETLLSEQYDGLAILSTGGF